MTKPLSPAAQAVLDAYETSYTESGLVAALRAAADVALPRNARGMANRQELRAYILAIAAELEGADG
jgi:hypothetical protein